MTTTKTGNAQNSVAAMVRQLRNLSSDMQMQQADVLLNIAQTPGLTMADLCKKTGLSQSAVSRNVAALSQFHRLGKPGLNLVEAVIDPREPRRRLVFLTTEGKTFMTKLVRTIDSEFSIDRDTDARVEVERMHEAAMQTAEASSAPKRGKIAPRK